MGVVHAKWVLGDKEAPVIRTMWAMLNKSDALAPGVGARLAACGINSVKSVGLLAATPPLNSKKLLFRVASKRCLPHGRPRELSFVGIRNSYFNGIPHKQPSPASAA